MVLYRLAELSLALVDDRRMATLHRQFADLGAADSPTVLTFSEIAFKAAAAKTLAT